MRVISGIIVRSGGKVLMCKRSSNETMPNKWSIPSGHANEFESPSDAAKREFYEETNIKIKKPIKLIDIIKPGSGNGLMYIYLLDSFNEIQPDLENAINGFEHSECGYFSKDELPFDKKEKDDLYLIIKKLLVDKK